MSKQHITEAVVSGKASPLKKALLAALAALMLSTAAFVPPVGAQVAPVDKRAVAEGGAFGLPDSYTDARGHKVFQCLGDALACAIEGDPAQAEEVIYWAGETSMPVGKADARGRTGSASIVMAVEGSFLYPDGSDVDANGNHANASTPGAIPVTGSVISINAKGLKPLTVYTVSHPYGSFKIRTNDRGQFPKNAKTLVESGCEVEGPEGCAFEDALTNPVFNNFLRPATTTWNSGASHLSNDTHLTTKVVGSLVKNAAGKPQNYFRIQGPDAGGAGKNAKTTGQFSIVGQLVQDTATEPAPPEAEE